MPVLIGLESALSHVQIRDTSGALSCTFFDAQPNTGAATTNSIFIPGR